MKVLLSTMFFQELEQAIPFFLQSLEELNPSFDKAIIFDFRLDQKLIEKNLPKNIAMQKVSLEKDFPKQLASLRNNVILQAKKEGFDAVLFLSSHIFPPKDLLGRLLATEKEIIAPVFFTIQNDFCISNAAKIVNENNEDKIEPFFFEELIPSGIKKVETVVLHSILLRKSVFEKLEFMEFKDSAQEMLFLAKEAKNLGKEVFVDSSVVCARFSQNQVVASYYFSVSNPKT